PCRVRCPRRHRGLGASWPSERSRCPRPLPRQAQGGQKDFLRPDAARHFMSNAPRMDLSRLTGPKSRRPSFSSTPITRASSIGVRFRIGERYGYEDTSTPRASGLKAGRTTSRSVTRNAGAFKDHAALESRDRDALLREGPFEPEVEVRDHEGPFVSQEEGEVPRRLHALRNLEPVHRRHGSQENEIRLGTGVPRLLASFGQSQVVDSSDIPLSRVAIAVTLLLAGIAVVVALNVAFRWSPYYWQWLAYHNGLVAAVITYLLVWASDESPRRRRIRRPAPEVRIRAAEAADVESIL